MSLSKDTLQLLDGLKLKGIHTELEAIIEEAEGRKVSYLSFLGSLLESEVQYRKSRRLQRNLNRTHFPDQKREKLVRNYDFSRVNGISKTETTDLQDFRWLDNRQNLLFFGPSGIGKTHLAIALVREAVEAGYTACFERATNLMQILKTCQIQRKAQFRINRIRKADLVIIDEVGYTPIERKEANLFFNLVSELYERSSIIITSNKVFSLWAEMMGDEIMTTAMLDRLLHHAKVFNMNGDSYRLTGKEE